MARYWLTPPSRAIFFLSVLIGFLLLLAGNMSEDMAGTLAVMAEAVDIGTVSLRPCRDRADSMGKACWRPPRKGGRRISGKGVIPRRMPDCFFERAPCNPVYAEESPREVTLVNTPHWRMSLFCGLSQPCW